MTTPIEKINNRIANTPELAQYADLLTYDWQDWDEQAQADWVATTSTKEIIEWCEAIRQDERDQREIEAIQDPANW